MKQKHFAISKVSLYHYFKLFLRSVFFLGAAALYTVARSEKQAEPFGGRGAIFFALIWLSYIAEMISRFFPSKLESPGCQKQFSRNYQPTEAPVPQSGSPKRTFAVAAAWLALNGLIGILYALSFIDAGILVLISLAYGVCDMICILFFCPFQTWFLKNRCCVTCRIYNWDFAMMFTPFLFTPHWYTYTLLALSLVLLLVWELSLHRHPERFSTKTNAYISCANCTEKLCKHKKQLRAFLKKRKKK